MPDLVMEMCIVVVIATVATSTRFAYALASYYLLTNSHSATCECEYARTGCCFEVNAEMLVIHAI